MRTSLSGIVLVTGGLASIRREGHNAMKSENIVAYPRLHQQVSEKGQGLPPLHGIQRLALERHN